MPKDHVMAREKTESVKLPLNQLSVKSG